MSANDYSVTEADIDAISNEVGMFPGGWDMVDPRELIAAVLARYGVEPNAVDG